MKFHSKHFLTRRNAGAWLGASALMALAGCGGGGSNNDGNGTGTSTNTENASLTAVNLTALTSNNQLLTFNSRTPGTSTTVAISGLTGGDTLRAIDFRFPAASTAPAPPITDSNGNNSLFAIGQNGASQQLYSLAVSGASATATPVGARFNLLGASSAAATSFGFDFNPTVDRIRVVEPTANRNFRLNPNTGTIADNDPVAAGVQPDGTLVYDASDANASQEPDLVAGAYLNPDADSATGTTLFVVDAARNTLAIQGRANDPATPADETVSPNSGSLFTVGNLSIDLSEDSGFDISPTGNSGFLSNGNRVYGISVSGSNRGALTGGARLTVPAGARIIGLAATS